MGKLVQDVELQVWLYVELNKLLDLVDVVCVVSTLEMVVEMYLVSVLMVVSVVGK